MSQMTYTSKRGKRIVFDEYVDNTIEYNCYWAEICPHCHNKYKGILGNRVSSGAMGVCSVEGCTNDATYYVDFDANEVIIDEYTEE